MDAKLDSLLTETHKKELDYWIKHSMNIQEEYELVQDIPDPYIFIRIKGSPKKINTELTMDMLHLYATWMSFIDSLYDQI